MTGVYLTRRGSSTQELKKEGGGGGDRDDSLDCAKRRRGVRKAITLVTTTKFKGNLGHNCVVRNLNRGV